MMLSSNLDPLAQTLDISKKATRLAVMKRPIVPFRNARTAFKALLQEFHFSEVDEILLPAYIGWSKNEGSGVFDPVREVGAQVRFYRLSRDLTIDLDDLRGRLKTGRPRLVVFIHYFGWPDVRLTEAVTLAREQGAFVLEDEAHALYSDWVSGICGRLGDAAIFSLHKMLPFDCGGWLVLNRSLEPSVAAQLLQSPLCSPLPYDPLTYDWFSIAAARRQNAQILLELLGPISDRIRPLYTILPDGVVPQTLPVIVTEHSRDDLYFKMNERGFGVVSLYHTLIETIQPAEFPDSYWLAKSILNLPVHQDIVPRALEAMVDQLGRVVR